MNVFPSDTGSKKKKEAAYVQVKMDILMTY